MSAPGGGCLKRRLAFSMDEGENFERGAALVGVPGELAREEVGEGAAAVVVASGCLS